MVEDSKGRGPAMAWLAAAGGVGLAVLYIAMIAAEGGVNQGEGTTFVLVVGSLLGAAFASAGAASTRRRRLAIGLLALALIPLLVWGVLAILSIGVVFLVVASLVAIALVQTVAGGGTRRYPASLGPDRR